MKKIFYLFLILSLFAVSCNDDDNDNDLGKEDDIIKIELYTEKDIANIFEIVTFGITVDRSFNLLELRETYDSLVWTVEDLGRFNILPYNRFTWQWSHNFFIPKEYETVLTGYKDNKVIMTDKLSVKIVNDKDFLSSNWDEITDSATTGTGYYNVFGGDSEYSTYHRYENQRPSMDVYIWYNRAKTDEAQFSEYSKEKLFSLMTALYAEPKYSKADDPNEIAEQYDKLFKHKEDDGAEPLNIWITPSSRIVLLKYKGYVLSEAMEYRIQAEPNN